MDLEKRLSREPQENYPFQSRVHPLRSIPHTYVKRDDELGFGISGSKFRKYRCLIPQLRGKKEVIILGGPSSNHILSLTQLLIENGIQPKLYLKGPPPVHTGGNFHYLQMLVPSTSIHWIPKAEWPPKVPQNATVIPEGAAVFPAFLGSLTLPLDILRNECEMGLSFDHIFIDAGTGYCAAALLLGLSFLEKKHHCHILLTADNASVFGETLHSLHSQFEEWLGMSCPFPAHFTCVSPTIAPSFGSTNAALFDFIVKTARTEGFFLDPIYSAKLFHHAYQIIPSLEGNSLLIHSGGALSLSGFKFKI